MAFVEVSKGWDAVAEIAGETSHLEFEGVYRATWPDVFRYAWLLLRQRQDAVDLRDSLTGPGFRLEGSPA